MLESFVVDGKLVELEIFQKTYRAELLNVTSCSDECENYIHSGLRFLDIQTGNLEEIKTDITYQIIGEEEGMLILKTLKGHSWGRT